MESKVFLEKLTVTQLAKKFPASSLPCSQGLATGLYLEPDAFSPDFPSYFPEMPCNTFVFRVVSSLKVFQLKYSYCMRLSY